MRGVREALGASWVNHDCSLADIYLAKGQQFKKDKIARVFQQRLFKLLINDKIRAKINCYLAVVQSYLLVLRFLDPKLIHTCK